MSGLSETGLVNISFLRSKRRFPASEFGRVLRDPLSKDAVTLKEGFGKFLSLTASLVWGYCKEGFGSGSPPSIIHKNNKDEPLQSYR